MVEILILQKKTKTTKQNIQILLQKAQTIFEKQAKIYKERERERERASGQEQVPKKSKQDFSYLHCLHTKNKERNTFESSRAFFKYSRHCTHA